MQHHQHHDRHTIIKDIANQLTAQSDVGSGHYIVTVVVMPPPPSPSNVRTPRSMPGTTGFAAQRQCAPHFKLHILCCVMPGGTCAFCVQSVGVAAQIAAAAADDDADGKTITLG